MTSREGTRVALVTGFEPYGGLRGNPSADVARALDGTSIGGYAVVGCVLPVALDGLGHRIERLLARTNPALVVAAGLAPDESVIRLERVGLNLADFDLPDNRGRHARDRSLDPSGPNALFATLPLRAIERALLRHGIPVRLSESAGLYLCNAMLYRALRALDGRVPAVPCGFVHLPCTPGQAAVVHGRGRDERVPPPSMALETMIEAVRVAVAVTARGLGAGTRRPLRREAQSGTGRSA